MRPRHKRVRGNMWTYDPQATEKNDMRLTLKYESSGWEMPKGTCIVNLEFHMDAYKGASKAESNLRLWGYSHTSRKDLDNMEKFVLDCGNNILWSDDRFIVQLSSRKLYSKNPCTIITIEPIKECKMEKSHEAVFKIFSPDDLCDFLDSICSLHLRIPSVNRPDRIELHADEMAPTADLLIKFANEWTDKLKKIRNK